MLCARADRHQAKPAAVSADMAVRGGSNIVTNLLAAESWLHCLLQAYQLHPVRTLHVCVCVCVCVCVVGFLPDVSLVGSAEEQRSYKLCVLCHFCHGHRQCAWSACLV